MTSRFVLVVLIAVMATTVFPAAASAQTNSRLVFEIKTLKNVSASDLVPTIVPPVATPVQPADPQPDPNIAILQGYLQQKGSPLAPFADTLLAQDNWKLILAISNGESTLCKHQMYNNCWGIGGAWNLKRYKSFEDAIPDVNNLLATRYIPDGLDTPKEMVNRYVGHPNSNWVWAANKILTEIDQLPLTN